MYCKHQHITVSVKGVFKMKEYRLNVKPHIFTFYHISSKLFFFLIFPFLQQIFLNPQNIWQRVNYTVINFIFISGVIITIGFEYKAITYQQFNNRIYYTKGVFHKINTTLPKREITCVASTTSYILSAVGCKKVNISTNVNYNDNAIQLYTNKFNAKQIIQYTFPIHNQKTICQQQILAPAVMAVTKTNALATALAISASTKRLGTIIGERLNDIILESIKTIPQLLLTGIPPTLSYISGFIFVGFFIGAVNQLLSSINFRCEISDKFISVTRGFIKKNILRFSREKLKGVIIKQTLIMCICKIYTLSLVCVTNIKKIDTTFALLSCNNKLKEYTEYVIPIEKYSICKKPHKSSLKSYLLALFIWLLVLTTVCIYLHSRFNLSFIAKFTAIILLPFVIVWLWFRVIAFKHCKIYVGESTIKLHYYHHINLYTAVVYKSAIRKVVVTQNPFQRASKKCHLKLYVQNKKKMIIPIKQLNLAEATELVHKLL